MFYATSKIAWLFLDPPTLLILLAGAGLVLALIGRRRFGFQLMTATIPLLAAISVLPLGEIMMEQLENRFPAYVDDGADIDGVVVLGGAIDPALYMAHAGSGMNGAVARVTEAARLARRYPRARVIFSGGGDATVGPETTEAHVVRDLFAALGVDEGRLEIETTSRNTYENAIMSRRMASPEGGERWLMITSAFHMPRAVGAFRAARFDVRPCPVDYRATGGSIFARIPPGAVKGLTFFSIAAHEIVGLIAYRLTGRSTALYPSL
jgi:uncharacterized SAM-binding protein YcdF (DUF218 family)